MPRLPLTRSASSPAPLVRADVLLERAQKLFRSGQHDPARGLCEAVLRADPLSAEAMNILGAIAAEQCRLGDAIGHFETALRISPDCVDAWRNRGVALSDVGLLDEALASFDQVVSRRADWHEGHALRAMTLYRLGRFEEAVRAHDPIAAAVARDGAMTANLATALLWSGHVDDAMAAFDRAVALDPDHATAWMNRGLAHLLVGDLPQGFRDFEWRWQRPEQAGAVRQYAQPLWTGQVPLAGKTILLHREQGFGDTIQFCRYASLAAAAGARVMLRVQPALVGLLRTLPGDVAVADETEPTPDFDLHCPLMSLPIGFATTIDTIPAAVPYLHADPARVAAWRSSLPPARGKRIGLVWAGGPFVGHPDQAAYDRRRSTRLSTLAPLGGVSGCEFVSLQVGAAAAQTREPPPGLSLLDRTGELHDFSDTAALIETLDLVIGVDTAVVHLAGALGCPVWLMNRFDTDWRWLLDRDDSPWYPTLRQFRQSTPGDWEGVVDRVARALEAFVAGSI